MARLAVWCVDAQHGEGALQPEPRKVDRSHIELEKYLEGWIAHDATLIVEGLTLVGRQLSIDDGRLDLLAIDSHDRWVVIEIKAGLLDSGTLLQALYYASSLVRLSCDELYCKLESGLSKLGDAEGLSTRVKQQLAAEEGQREIAVLLVGAGVHPGLERMNGELYTILQFGPRLSATLRSASAEPYGATLRRLGVGEGGTARSASSSWASKRFAWSCATIRRSSRSHTISVCKLTAPCCPTVRGIFTAAHHPSAAPLFARTGDRAAYRAVARPRARRRRAGPACYCTTCDACRRRARRGYGRAESGASGIGGVLLLPSWASSR